MKKGAIKALYLMLTSLGIYEITTNHSEKQLTKNFSLKFSL